jgi:hypothetical protein
MWPASDLDLLQWQAQDEPQPPAAVSPPDDELLAGAAGADSLAAAAVEPVAAVVAAEPPEPPLKSVAYQPEPLSWKPAAVTCFLKDSAPQAGQVLSTGSDIFCKTSLA